MTNTPVADRLVEVWDAEFKTHAWAELSTDDLISIERILWGMHQDAVLEWVRRKMREEA